MESPDCGACTDNKVTTTSSTIILIIIKRSETAFVTSTLSIYFSANKTPTTPVPGSLPFQKHLYLESLPSIILADAPLHLHSCIQRKSIHLLGIVSNTSLDVFLNVPISRLVIFNALVSFCLCRGYLQIDDPVGLQSFKPTLP